MSTWALIPIKGFDHAKSRLSEVLGPEERARLARELFEHVVSILRQAPEVDEIAVISDSDETREHAERLGLLPLTDPPGAPGLASVVDDALGDLANRGAEKAVVCMSDLPELTCEDIADVMRALKETDVVLVPDRLGEGTNVIALAPPTVLPSCLGHEDSLRRHLLRAEELGLTVSVQLSSGIAFDIDDPGDLARLRER
ncbi:MAG: 2-phospho-L-lactate guanylyltransferase [Myxococcales bacterium]|nr:2-phospho-L-lactate guanylyltransferase [Myxococcales bacterium]MDH3484260.1 2-phospho-L-lactate guanylyltransferase [Myxococcales bacterium]